jgi:hypothetical protein
LARLERTQRTSSLEWKGTVKPKILSTLFILSTVAALAATNEPDSITFTNRAGQIAANARVIGRSATEIYYEVPGGGARVKLADLPASIQRDFH